MGDAGGEEVGRKGGLMGVEEGVGDAGVCMHVCVLALGCW